MAVDTTTRKVTYTCSAVADYSFTFRALTSTPTDIKCKLKVLATGVETDLTYTTHYTVAVNSNGVGGTLTMVTTYGTTHSITIYRETTDKQESDYNDYNQFPADTLETDLDRRTMKSQEAMEDIARALKVSVSSTLSNITLPNPDLGKSLVWSAGGTVVNSTYDADSIGTLCAAYASTASTQAAAAAASALLSGYYASTASTQATAAATSATSAATSATAAIAAATSATASVASATAATLAASSHATTALTHATTAGSHATTVLTAATLCSSYATNALTYSTTASSHATTAITANTSAIASATSATASVVAATAATLAALNAQYAAQTANTSAIASATSATASVVSATAATLAALNAQYAAQTGATDAIAAATSATASVVSATAATLAALNAQYAAQTANTSAIASATSATASVAAATAATLASQNASYVSQTASAVSVAAATVATNVLASLTSANVNLSNLTAVAVNTSILASDSTINIGDLTTKRFATVFASTANTLGFVMSNASVAVGRVLTCSATGIASWAALPAGGDTLDVFTVGPNGDYTTIQAALNAVVGTTCTILVASGTYNEALTFKSDNIVLKATGGWQNTTITQAAAKVIEFGTSSSITLDGFTVSVTAADGNGDYIMYGSNDDATAYNIIKNCYLSWASTAALNNHQIISLTDGNWRFENCTIVENSTFNTGDANTSYPTIYFTYASVDHTADIVQCDISRTKAGKNENNEGIVQGYLLANLNIWDSKITGTYANTSGTNYMSAVAVTGDTSHTPITCNIYNSYLSVNNSGNANGIACVYLGDSTITCNIYNSTINATGGGTHYSIQTASDGAEVATFNLYGVTILDGTFNKSSTGVHNLYNVDDGGIVHRSKNSGFSAYMSGNQSVTTATITLLKMDSEDFDLQGEFNTSTYTFTANDSGYYQVNAGACFDLSTDGKSFYVAVFLNGAAVKYAYNCTASTAIQVATYSGVLYVAAGQTLDCRAYHERGSTASAMSGYCWFSAMKIA